MQKLNELETGIKSGKLSPVWVAVDSKDILVIVEEFRALEKERDELKQKVASQEKLQSRIDTGMKWRDIALQFDGHRMQALYHLKQVMDYPGEESISKAREFILAPPLPGKEVLKAQLVEMFLKLVPEEMTWSYHDNVTQSEVISRNAYRAEILHRIEEQYK